jgi:hypothetical protein
MLNVPKKPTISIPKHAQESASAVTILHIHRDEPIEQETLSKHRFAERRAI